MLDEHIANLSENFHIVKKYICNLGKFSMLLNRIHRYFTYKIAQIVKSGIADCL